MTVQRPCTAAVTEIAQDAWVGSAMENGTPVRPFALRQHDLPQEWGTTATLCGRQASSQVEGQALSTFHHPMTYRCSLAPGYEGHDKDPRRSCPPPRQGVSPAQPMRHRVRRVAWALAGGCGGRRRPRALLVAVLCRRPLTQAAIKRWLEAMGSHWPTPAPRLPPLLALPPAPEWPRDGSSPLGTDPGVLGVKEEPARLLSPPAAAAEHGEAAGPGLHQRKDRGLHGTAAVSEASSSCTAALNAVGPQARFQAAQCPTGKQSWGHLKKAL